MTEQTAEPRMLVLARESRGWTQTDLAHELSRLSDGGAVSQGYVSKAEAGRTVVTGTRLHLFSRALRYAPDLLCSDAEVHGVGVGLVHHRKRASIGAHALRRIHAVLALTRLQTSALAGVASTNLSHRFRHIAVDDFDTPQDAAGTIRKEWGLQPGPIPNLVEVVEAVGAFVVARDLTTRELDAVSQWSPPFPPLFLINTARPADRFRFSLAHEIGHVIMHAAPSPGKQQENEADAFAAEFLMPYEGVREDFTRGVDLDRLMTLKKHWGVSMAGLLRRALSLGAVSDWQYRNIMIEMSAMGYRTDEPIELPSEYPGRIPSIVKSLEEGYALGVPDIARLCGLTADEFDDLYLSVH